MFAQIALSANLTLTATNSKVAVGSLGYGIKEDSANGALLVGAVSGSAGNQVRIVDNGSAVIIAAFYGGNSPQFLFNSTDFTKATTYFIQPSLAAS